MKNISRPTLLLNKDRCMTNINRMHDKAKKSSVVFRPHFKTHNSAYIGNWFRRLGIHSITVSSVTMAKFFSAYGWRDITIAFPVNLPEINLINEFAYDLNLNIQGDNVDILPQIESAINIKAGFFIEIDTGHHRTGVAWENLEEIDRMINFLENSSRLKFRGFITHAGHTYSADSPEEIMDIYHDTVEKLNFLKARYREVFPDLIISYGDTPSCSLVDDFSGVDEIRPGNFIFYDLMQFSLGACTLDQIALAMACPVVAKSTERSELTIYGGAIHFSKDFLYRSTGEHLYGYVVNLKENEWSEPLAGAYLAKLSQEHGTIHAPKEFIQETRIGDILGVLPVHSCLTANLMKGFQTLEGDMITY